MYLDLLCFRSGFKVDMGPHPGHLKTGILAPIFRHQKIPKVHFLRGLKPAAGADPKWVAHLVKVLSGMSHKPV